MSSRHTRGFFGVLLVVVLALSAIIVAPASAKLTKSQKVHIRHQLRKAIHKNPKLIRSKSFIKKASLVNFQLPVTIRLRGSSSPANPNNANIDLGASLGQREVNLGGKLAAQIVFHDSFDGGALGNVDLNILNGPKSLSSTSIPLLWNSDVSQAGSSWDSGILLAGGASQGVLDATGHKIGCGDVHNNTFAPANPATGQPYVNANGNLPFGANLLPTPGPGNSASGVPIYNAIGGGPNDYPSGTPLGTAPAHIASTNPNVDNSIDALAANKSITGIPSVDNNHLGGNPNPFPYTASSNPGGAVYTPSTKDTVLRTNALSLQIAQPGTEINQATNTNGVAGSENIVVGKSGGHANLFGNIPGKGYGIDVTVNLATKINSILRVEDQDAFAPLIVNGNWPAAVFGCTQVWTGAVQNYIPSVHLVGNLKISPGITADGHLRIAKATIATPQTGTTTADKARFAVAACLMPFSAYNQETGLNTVPNPVGNQLGDGSLVPSVLPADSSNVAPTPSATCNSTPTTLVGNSALAPVLPLAGATAPNGYTVGNSGSTVSVGADLDVKNVSVDVLIGDV